MATLEDRVGKLEIRVGTRETWDGPDRLEALLQGQQQLRTQLREVEQVQELHGRILASLKTDAVRLKADVAGLKRDVAVLKADMAQVKEALQEVLRRLPPGA